MADGNITVEVSTQAAQAELERLRAENARLAREAHTWWTALAGATAEIEQWRRTAERCVTAWTVVRGGVWDPNGLMDEHVDALRKALGPNVRAKLPAEAGAVSLVRDDAPCAADQAYSACRSGSA